MDKSNIENILQEYDDKIALYSRFTDKVKHLVEEILREKNVKVHSVTARVKDRKSLIRKLEKQDSDYSRLSEITDITGVRIITYFSDDVDQIAELIEQEFLVDKANSVDKRAQLDPDRFGYLSLHHVVQFAKDRISLVEYKRFQELSGEIQTRSILQHSWAEIEHDLGYKTAVGIPKDARRKFSRLASLLELADEEFLAVRKQLQKYNRSLTDQITKTPDRVPLDRDSLMSYVKTNNLIHEIDKNIAKLINATIRPPRAEYVERFIPRLKALGIESIRDLQQELENNRTKIVDFANEWLDKGSKTHNSFGSSICLFYLTYLLLGYRYSEKDIAEYLTHFSIGVTEKEILAKRVKEIIEIIRNK